MNEPVLGVLVPCRDEARVIERKLANLARVDWPRAGRPHLVVVVDDGSQDGTAAVAERAIARGFAGRPEVAVRVVANTGAPGKASAIARGLAELGSEPDLVVLTDADVIFERPALVELANAFARDPRLGMACGAQRFVRALGDDGDAHADLVDDAGLYDRWTAGVRRFESRSGRLFSVHGQLLAWRRALALAATPGLAADDIDLRLQARARGARIELVAGARFVEVKAPAGEARREQELRRARAYVQCVESPHVAALAARGDALDRLHFACYRHVPLLAPWLVLAALVAAPLAAGAFAAARPSAASAGAEWALAESVGGVALGAAVLGLELLLALSPPGRRLARLFSVIVRATRAERREPLSGTWRTARR
ncbi:MAG: glycosyltransferase [Planctomycetes bacterium]|nr:glycosyltransferase [Planctomycetota bacterium]